MGQEQKLPSAALHWHCMVHVLDQVFVGPEATPFEAI